MLKQPSAESLEGTSSKAKSPKNQSYATVTTHTLPAPAQPRRSLLASAGFATFDDDSSDSANML